MNQIPDKNNKIKVRLSNGAVKQIDGEKLLYKINDEEQLKIQNKQKQMSQ